MATTRKPFSENGLRQFVSFGMILAPPIERSHRKDKASATPLLGNDVGMSTLSSALRREQLPSILKPMPKRREIPRDAAAIDGLLPVRPAAFAVLAALADRPRPGFEIMERVNQAIPSRPLLGPGTLYRLMRELRRTGWIERTEPPQGEEGAGDEPRQYHGLTKLGRRVLAAESARLRRTLVMVGRLGESHGGP